MKFEGGYHGMSAEAQMSLAPTQLVNFPNAVPDSAGIPDSVRDEMLIAPFNDTEFAVSLIAEHADELGLRDHGTFATADPTRTWVSGSGA